MRLAPALGLPIALVIGLVSIACHREPPLRVRKENLGSLPIPWHRPSIHVAEDGKHITFTVRDGDRYRVVTPTGRGAPYVEVSPPFFAPKSTRVFHWGATDVDGRRRFDVVVDGVPTATPFVEPADLVYPPGGARWAAFGFVEATGGARTMAVVVDGVEQGRWPEVSRPAFSSDGGHVAWLARDPAGSTTLYVDGAAVRSVDGATPTKDGPRFDHLASVRYLADGRLFALAPEGAGWAIHRDGERLASYGQNLVPGSTLLLAGPGTTASVVASSIVTADAAPVAVWWERMAGAAERWRVVRDGAAVDGLVCDQHWATQPPVLTDDGRHVAYVCPSPPEATAPLGRRWVVLDGRRFGSYADTWTLGVAPDGSQVAYGAAESLPVMTWRLFANGMPKGPDHELIWRPRFAPAGTRVFWAGGPERGRRMLGIDGRVVTRFDDVVYGPEFPAPGTAVWVIRRGRRLSRIEAQY